MRPACRHEVDLSGAKERPARQLEREVRWRVASNRKELAVAKEENLKDAAACGGSQPPPHR